MASCVVEEAKTSLKEREGSALVLKYAFGSLDASRGTGSEACWPAGAMRQIEPEDLVIDVIWRDQCQSSSRKLKQNTYKGFLLESHAQSSELALESEQVSLHQQTFVGKGFKSTGSTFP